jgi:hypothetical protein
MGLWVVLLLVQVMPLHTYYPETIDSLTSSTRTYVQITGTTMSTTLARDGRLNVTLRDGHGHTLSCIWARTLRDQPRIGVEIVIYGRVQRLRFEDQPMVVEIDPVDRFDPVEDLQA